MKITDVSLTLFAWNDIPATSYGGHAGEFKGSSELGLLTIQTDEGLEGHAFLGSAMRGAGVDGESLIRHLKPQIMGENPLARERLYRKLWQRNRHTSLRCIGAVDVALWDLGGKAANMPIHQLLGSFRTSVPAYASSVVLDEPLAYADQAAEFKARGWPAYKIHPPARWKEDIAVCEAVRNAVGDDYTVMLDSTWSYRYEEALRVGKAIEEMGYYWYEDPLADDDIYNCAKLRRKLSIPLMATITP